MTNPTERPEIEKRLEDGPIGSAWYEEVIRSLLQENASLRRTLEYIAEHPRAHSRDRCNEAPCIEDLEKTARNALQQSEGSER